MIKAELKEDLRDTTNQGLSDSVAQPEKDNDNSLNALNSQPAQPEHENTDSPLAAKPKPRGTILPKLRNILVRKTYLKVTLGRRLASPIKEALRYQAQGLDTTIIEIRVAE